MTLKTKVHFRLMTLVFAVAALTPTLLAARKKPDSGERVADFAFTDFSGKQHHLSDYSGHYVLLDFWATWCGPCMKEVPTLKKAEKLYRQRGLQIVGMNSDRKIGKAKTFVRRKKIPWPQSSPASTKKVIDGALNIKWYPTLILLNSQRRIVFVSGNGKPALHGKKLLQKLNQILPSAGS